MSAEAKLNFMTSDPIFIHSIFRAGSTYAFNVFRRSKEGYWCYQEPLHEVALFSKSDPQILLESNECMSSHLRHPRMDRPYFLELHHVAHRCLGALTKESIYDAYFAESDDNFGAEFWQCLIGAAEGRPVIQECRTSCRIGLIKKALGGQHLYLWRNPWDQWWSFKVEDYFDEAAQLFINAPEHPEVIERLRHEIGFEAYASDDLLDQFKWFKARPLSPDHSYLVFYVLWFLGLLEGRNNADLLLNIDRLSDSPEYRLEFMKSLEHRGIGGVDFSDCDVPQAIYGREDQAFFRRIEDKAHGLMLLAGMSQGDVDRILALRKANEPRVWQPDMAPPDLTSLTRDAERARTLVRRFEGQAAELHRALLSEHDRVNAAEERTEAAERGTHEAEARAQEGEARTQQAEARTQQAEARTQQAEAKAQEVEAKAQQVEAKAQQAEAKAQQAEAALVQALTQLRAVYASTSWRITGPLRAVKRISSGDLSPISRCANSLRSTLAVVPGARKAYPIIKDPVGHGIRFAIRRPRLKNRLRSIIRHVPVLERWLIERRAAQLRADFSRAWSEKGIVTAGLQAVRADFSFQGYSHKGKRSVEEILERIRAELSQANRD